MIVVISLKNGNNKKVMVRNQIFHEVNLQNKKGDSITTSSIKSVFWPNKEGMQQIPVKEWLEMADSASYWNIE